MALSNLITEKLEVFGGIDLKKNYQKYFSNALGISIGIHLLVILFYLGWTWFKDDNGDRVPHIRIHNIAELAPPPSTQDQPQEAPPVAPPPAADVVKPSLGIPVPVPDAVAPQVTLPDMNQPAPPVQSTGTGSGVVTDLVQTNAPVNLNIKPEVEAEPDKDAFVDVSEMPEPVVPIEKLIQYPEIAKRSNLEGKVIVEALISKDGTVEKVDVVKADYDIFKDAAVDAMKRAKFTPARQNGTPLRLWVTRTIKFQLSK